MAAELLEPITVRVLTRPVFHNKNIADQGLWEFDNAAMLARYWNDQGNVLGLEPDTTDFDLWLRVQYDLEWQRHHRRLLPHGSSL